jgi:hypothetical protein
MGESIMNSNQELRQQLINMLVKQQAHMQFEDAIADFPAAHINTRPPQLDYSFWHLLEHLRICQYDILNYMRNPEYQMLDFPAGYWPAKDIETDAVGWQQTIDQFLRDRQAIIGIINDPETDLYAPIPHGWDGHNILREVLVVADHNAYHIGEFGILRHILNLW